MSTLDTPAIDEVVAEAKLVGALRSTSRFLKYSAKRSPPPLSIQPIPASHGDRCLQPCFATTVPQLLAMNSLSSTETQYETGIVSFIDILGFRDLLRTLTASDVRGLILKLREFGKGDGDTRPEPTRMKNYRLHSEAFSESVSDGVIRCRTVDTQYPSGPFILELIDLMHCVVETVSAGFLLRAGMTIGDANIEQGGPLFGPGIVRAVELEEQQAIYPRILIDTRLIESYETDERLWQDGQRDDYEDQILKQFIARDADGSFYLDYLSAAGPGEFDAGLHGQFEFLKCHRDLANSGLMHEATGVRRKYVWLARYHNAFVAKLRQDYDLDDANGDFEAEIGVSPRDLFDDLTITSRWTSYS